MKSKLVPAALAAVLSFMAPAHAGHVVCKASVQDAHGIATGWIGNDGQQTMPVKALFVFPPGTVARDAAAGDYALGKPANLPADSLFVSAQFALAMDGNDLRIGLDTLEIDGPAITRVDGKQAAPMFLAAAGGETLFFESAAIDGEVMGLRLHTDPGHSQKGDLTIPDEDKAGVSKLFAGGDAVIAASDIANPHPIYRAVVPMTDSATVQSMLVAALKKAAAAAPSGEGCQVM
jgi:hypothetical protein